MAKYCKSKKLEDRKKYACDNCGRKFVRPDTLKRHIKDEVCKDLKASSNAELMAEVKKLTEQMAKLSHLADLPTMIKKELNNLPKPSETNTQNISNITNNISNN